MRIGVVFPQTEIGNDFDVIAEFARAAEEAGFAFLMAYDHVLGADRSTRPDWAGTYDASHPFHEPFVLFGYLAAICRLELVTGVLVLPQRQTALVAKQAAEIDLLTGGRFRLGVGIGWNGVEYEALGMDFRTRARRFEEQIDLLRLLWTQDIVSYEGRFHRVDRAGILPRPRQQPIPIWIGGANRSSSPRVFERIGRLADGWIAQSRATEGVAAGFAQIRRAAADAGRDPEAVALQGAVRLSDLGDVADMAALRRELDALEELGASHASVITLGSGLSPRAHVDTVRRIGDALGLRP